MTWREKGPRGYFEDRAHARFVLVLFVTAAAVVVVVVNIALHAAFGFSSGRSYWYLPGYDHRKRSLPVRVGN